MCLLRIGLFLREFTVVVREMAIDGSSSPVNDSSRAVPAVPAAHAEEQSGAHFTDFSPASQQESAGHAFGQCDSLRARVVPCFS